MKSLSLNTNLSFANNDTLCHHLSSKQSNLALWQSNIRFIVWSAALLQRTKYHLLKSSGGLPTLSLKSSCCPKAKLISFYSIEAKNNPNQPYKILSLCGRLHRDLPCTFLSHSEHMVLKLPLKNPWELSLCSQFLILSLSLPLLPLASPWHRTN